MRADVLAPDHLLVAVESEADTARVGAALAALVTPGTVIGLVGTLGAGKTRLVRALSESLGVDPAAISSPTFMLIHEYDGRLPVFHFDSYRLPDADSFDALGASDYWAEPVGVCLVEWADLVADRLPRSAWWVRLSPTGPTSRQLDIQGPDAADLAGRLGVSAPESPGPGTSGTGLPAAP